MQRPVVCRFCMFRTASSFGKFSGSRAPFVLVTGSGQKSPKWLHHENSNQQKYSTWKTATFFSDVGCTFVWVSQPETRWVSLCVIFCNDEHYSKRWSKMYARDLLFEDNLNIPGYRGTPKSMAWIQLSTPTRPNPPPKKTPVVTILATNMERGTAIAPATFHTSIKEQGANKLIPSMSSWQIPPMFSIRKDSNGN